MARNLRFKFFDERGDLATDSTGELERLQVTDGPYRWASLETFDGELPADVGAAAAGFEASEIDDTGAVTEHYGVLMLVAFNVPAERAEEVEAWYVQEHVPLLMRAPGWLRARRYLVRNWYGPIKWTHLAFHELRNLGVLATEERAFARSTAWRAVLSAERWFEEAGRILFEPLP